MLPKLDMARALLRGAWQCGFVSNGAASMALLMLQAHTDTHPGHWAKISSRADILCCSLAIRTANR